MQCRAFLGSSNLVVNSNLNRVAPICLNERGRKLAIDEQCVLLVSIG